jgi:hypothetical protein
MLSEQSSFGGFHAGFSGIQRAWLSHRLFGLVFVFPKLMTGFLGQIEFLNTISQSIPADPEQAGGLRLISGRLP